MVGSRSRRALASAQSASKSSRSIMRRVVSTISPEIGSRVTRPNHMPPKLCERWTSRAARSASAPCSAPSGSTTIAQRSQARLNSTKPCSRARSRSRWWPSASSKASAVRGVRAPNRVVTWARSMSPSAQAPRRRAGCAGPGRGGAVGGRPGSGSVAARPATPRRSWPPRAASTAAHPNAPAPAPRRHRGRPAGAAGPATVSERVSSASPSRSTARSSASTDDARSTTSARPGAIASPPCSQYRVAGDRDVGPETGECPHHSEHTFVCQPGSRDLSLAGSTAGWPPHGSRTDGSPAAVPGIRWLGCSGCPDRVSTGDRAVRSRTAPARPMDRSEQPYRLRPDVWAPGS